MDCYPGLIGAKKGMVFPGLVIMKTINKLRP